MASLVQVTASSRLVLLLVASALLLVGEVAACGGCSKPTPPPPSPSSPCPPAPASGGKCPRDALKLGVCANVLGLVKVSIGKVPTGDTCCPLLDGLADLEAAVCLCTALKANVLGINLDIPIKLTLLLNYCGKTLPEGFICA